MKVLYIVTAYPRERGDVITPWLVETIHRLRPAGVEVEVLAPSYRGLGDQVVEGVRVHRFRYAPAAWETLTHEQTAPDRVRQRPAFLGLVPGYVAAGSLAAARLARSGQFSVLHAFWHLPHGLLGMAGKRAARVPLVSTFFGVELSWLESQLRPLRPVVRGIVRASDAVTVISSHTEAQVRRLAPDAVLRTIPFGATTSAATVAGAPRPREADGFRLLFVGRLVERKGVAVLLDALARLRAEEAEHGPVRLDVVGEGPLRAELEAQAVALGVADRVDFAGGVSAEELARRFAACDAFVLPAVQDAKGDVEGLGVVLIEALLHGRPVIATASGGIVDIVRHEETGLLVPPGDAVALAGAVRRYQADPELAQRLAAAGAEWVAERFSWSRIVGDLASLYRQLSLRTEPATDVRP